MEDKLLFINSFVLLNYDNELLNNLKIKGKESFLNIYIDQHQNEFKDNFNNYMKLDTELYNLYSEFNNEKINLKN